MKAVKSVFRKNYLLDSQAGAKATLSLLKYLTNKTEKNHLQTISYFTGLTF